MKGYQPPHQLCVTASQWATRDGSVCCRHHLFQKEAALLHVANPESKGYSVVVQHGMTAVQLSYNDPRKVTALVGTLTLNNVSQRIAAEYKCCQHVRWRHMQSR